MYVLDSGCISDANVLQGGVMDKDEIDIKQHLHRLIEYFSKLFPDPARVAEDLWKFAKMHDRRCYALIRFCMAPESDFRKVYKSFVSLLACLLSWSQGLRGE